MKLTSLGLSAAGLAASVVLVLTTSLPASAAGGTVVVPTVSATADQSKDAVLAMDDHVARWRPLEASVAADLVEGAREAGVAPQGNVLVDYDKALAWRISDHARLVRIPASSGQGVLPQSALSVVFDDDGAVVGVSQWIFTPLTADSGRVQSWLDGALVLDQSVTAQGVATAPQVSASAYKKGDWWGNFNQCLSNAGVAAWVITGISIACAAICVVTVGVGCVACIGAASAGFSGTVSFCITTANLNS